MNSYDVMRDRQRKEFNEFTKGRIFYAFDGERFKKGLKKIKLKEGEKVVKWYAGGFGRERDVRAAEDMLKRHHNEVKEAMAADQTGDGFIYDMFRSEMFNHEYGYTGDSEYVLNALGLTWEEIEKDPALEHGFKKAAEYVNEATE